MKHIVKKWLAGILSVVMVFSLLPVMARAEEDGETPEKTAVERVQELIDGLPEAESITADNRADVEAQIDAIDGAMTELSEDEAAALDTARYDAAAAALSALDDQIADPDPEPSAAERVQALIDALPDTEEITADNRADVEAQLTAIDEAKLALEDEELDALDITRYMAAVEAILALDDMAGANEPATITTANNVSYIDSDGSTKSQSNVTVVETSTTTWSNGWYVVDKSLTISERITSSGDVHLILKDGCTLTATAGVTALDKLTIYGQAAGTGTIEATSNAASNSAIGGDLDMSSGSANFRSSGTIVINGGKVIATGVYNSRAATIGGGESSNCGDITINGGTVIANCGQYGHGAGIGGSEYHSGGTIIINGGNVTANAESGYAAGIGGGISGSGGNITINGGTVSAYSNLGGAGIGGGQNGAGGTVTIYKGTITATSIYGAGIGGGQDGAGGTITINGGNIISTSTNGGAGIGGGQRGAGGIIIISGGNITSTSTGSKPGDGIGGGMDGDSGSFSTGANGNAVIYANSVADKSNQSSWSGIIFEGNAGTVYGNQTLRPDFALTGSQSLTVGDKASLTVPDGATMTVPAGATVTNNGTIYVGTKTARSGVLSISGGINNKGTIDVWGTINNEEKVNNSGAGKVVYHFNLEVTPPTFSAEFGYSQPAAKAIKITSTDEIDATIDSVEITGGEFVLNTGDTRKTLKKRESDESWTIQPVAGLSAGTHTATVTVTYSGSGGVSRTATAEVTFTVTKAESDITAPEVTATYGDSITLTATVKGSGVNGIALMSVPEENKVQFSFPKGKSLEADVQYNDDNRKDSGTASVTISAEQVKNYLNPGQNQVTVSYGGSGSLNPKDLVKMTVTVQQKTLTFNFKAQDKVYDGNSTIKGTFDALTDQLVSSDVVTVKTYTANTSDPDVGTEKTVTVEVTELGGDAAKYYTPGAAASNNIEITKAESGMSGPTGKNDLVYNGKDQELIQTAGEATGGSMMYYVGATAPGTDADGWKDAIADIKGKDAGTYTVWYYVKGDDNHNNTAPANIIVEIAQKTVELTWTGHEGLTYTGSAHTISATVSNKALETDDVNVTVEVSANGDETGVSGAAATNAGSYTAEATGLTGSAAKNYKLPSEKTKVFTIAKAPVSFTVKDNDVTYDTQTHTATVKQTESESPNLGDGDFIVTYGDDKTANKTNAGEYDIYVTLKNDNFKFANLDDDTREKKLSDKLTIKQAALTLNVSGSAITYGQTLSESELSGTAKLSNGTEITGTWSWEDGSKNPAVADSNTTKYTVKFIPTSSGAGNFTEGSLTTKITITVNKKTLTPNIDTVEDIEQFGGTTATTGTIKLEGAVLSEAPKATGTFNFDTATAGENKSVTVTNIKLNDSWGENYVLSVDHLDRVATNAKIGKRVVELEWKLNGEENFTVTYSGKAVSVTATVTNLVDGYACTVTVTDGDKTDAGTYTAKAALSDEVNYTLPVDGTERKEYTIEPAKVSFAIGNEDRTGWNWEDKGETNADPNAETNGYTVNSPTDWTDYTLSMTYDSYNHKANVTQKAGEAVKIIAGSANGFTVTYKKDGTGDDIKEIRDAGTYDIMVNLTPTEGNIYNYAFDERDASVHSLKIGEITVEPYTVHVTWSHLKYVYHAHKMHPNVRVQNAFKADVQPEVVPDGFDPAKGYSGELLAFAETSGADVRNYDVEVELYGTSAGNYVVDDNTETVTIVPAPVTFTVGDNVWVIDESGALSSNTVTLRPAWGAVSTTPDVAVHHSYPLAGTKITEDLETQIVYKKDGEEVTSPGEAGKYEVWVKIGNENYRHSATETGELHHVGELVITDDPNSIRTYTVTFDPGYEGAPKGPAAIEKAFPNQTVVLPPVSGENEDGTTYDITREGYSFLGWSYNGRTYQPNEELHMPAADVTFKGEWIEAVPIGGRVVQESSGGEATPVNGATVVLKQGSEPTAEAVTGSDGTFDFGLVTPGIYNLEVTYENGGGAKIVKTFLIEVGDSGSVDNEFVLPDTALNTVVEVAPGIKSAVSMDGMITDEAAAEVYTESDKQTVAEGGTVEFKMSISETTLTGPQEEEIPVPEERISMVLDMKLTKTVTSSSGTNTTEITDSKIPVTTVIHLPAEIQGKSGYTVYRFHDEDGDDAEETMQTITTSKNENGEYLEVIRDGTAIELHAEFYSTYVLTWYQSSGGGATAYPVTLPENALNGTVTANYEKAVKNSVVTLTVTPDEGHVLGELTVTDSEGNAIALTDNGDGTYSFVMPDGGVTVKAVFVCEGGENCQSRKFTDLDVKAWYHDYTDYVIGCGLMHGVGGNLFDPNGAVTRAQMVTVLWNMSGDPVVNYYMTYSDVSESAWYAEAIRWATSEGVVDGYGNGKFGPNDPITREQMAVMLYRYERKYGDGGFTGEWMYRLPFTDLDQISDWAFEAVAWCNMKGIITGKDGNRLDPKGPAKRCEMAAVLARYRYENDTKNDTE